MVPWYTDAFRIFAAIGVTGAAVGLGVAAARWAPAEPSWVKPMLQAVALWWALWAAYRWFVVVVDLRNLDSIWVRSFRRGDISNIFTAFAGLSGLGIALGGRSMYRIAQVRYRRLEQRVNGT